MKVTSEAAACRGSLVFNVNPSYRNESNTYASLCRSYFATQSRIFRACVSLMKDDTLEHLYFLSYKILMVVKNWSTYFTHNWMTLFHLVYEIFRRFCCGLFLPENERERAICVRSNFPLQIYPISAYVIVACDRRSCTEYCRQEYADRMSCHHARLTV